MKNNKAKGILAAAIIMSLIFSLSVSVLADYDEILATPENIVLNRGHIDALAFGGQMGVSWSEVEGAESYTVFVFTDADEQDVEEAYLVIDGIEALYLYVNDVVDEGTGPFWFRVQASAYDFEDSELSDAVGPFWNFMHSDEFADNPYGSYAIFTDPEVPVIVIDTRRPVEREDQGHVVGDVHVNWPNAAGVEEGITHAEFQAGILAVWQNFIAGELTDEQRANLNPEYEYRDIHIFIY